MIVREAKRKQGQMQIWCQHLRQPFLSQREIEGEILYFFLPVTIVSVSAIVSHNSDRYIPLN